MISFRTADILDSGAQVLINTVNTKGVMGKGIALAFKKRYPLMYKEYRSLCEEGGLAVGRLHVWASGMDSPATIINFPTKQDWRAKSKMDYIRSGLSALDEWVQEHHPVSIAIPPLGCGNGGLDWAEVRVLISDIVSSWPDTIDVLIYEPGFIPKPESSSNDDRLTTLRATFYSVLYDYQLNEDTIYSMTCQKLAYFMQRLGTPMNLSFDKGWFGPYAPILNKVIERLAPHYLTVEGDLGKPTSVIHLDYSKKALVDEKLIDADMFSRSALEVLPRLIDGFETTYGLELLSSVDFALLHRPDGSLEEIVEDIHSWTRRKQATMPPHMISAAFERISQFKGSLKGDVARS